MDSSSKREQPAQVNEELDQLGLIRSILLREDREQVETVATGTRAEIELLERQLAELRDKLARLEAIKADADDVLPTAEASLPTITSNAVSKQHSAMTNALAPIMGDALKTQINESRDVMVEALSPIMLSAIGLAIRDAMKELQEQIDARLSRKQTPERVMKRISAEMQGVSSAERTLRDALPYSIDQIFLIQNDSGLLIAHYTRDGDETDSDLIGAMLTAIRDFVGDAFAGDGESSDLQEVQFGQQRIILKNGTSAYCAVVGDGVEPAGFRQEVQTFVAELHAAYGKKLRDFEGDVTAFPEIPQQLAAFAGTYEAAKPAASTAENTPGLPTIARLGIGCLAMGLLLSLCFSSWFIYSLMPTALARWQPTAVPTATVESTPLPTVTPQPTPTLVPTETATVIPTSTPTNTPTPSPSNTPMPAATSTATPRPTATQSPTSTPTSEPRLSVAEANATVWVRSQPSTADGEQLFLVEPGDSLIIGEIDGNWIRVTDPESEADGWILQEWLELDG